MNREISYYGTGKEETVNDISYLPASVKVPGRTQLNIAIFAAGIAIVLAMICGYYAYYSDDAKQGNSNSKSLIHK